MHAWQIHLKGYFAICMCAQRGSERPGKEYVWSEDDSGYWQTIMQGGTGLGEPSWVL